MPEYSPDQQSFTERVLAYMRAEMNEMAAGGLLFTLVDAKELAPGLIATIDSDGDSTICYDPTLYDLIPALAGLKDDPNRHPRTSAFGIAMLEPGELGKKTDSPITLLRELAEKYIVSLNPGSHTIEFFPEPKSLALE